jgi:hypothetical protein
MVAIGRATVGLVPVVGNVLSEALTVSIPRQRMDRLTYFAAEVARRVGHLEEQDLRRRVQRHLPLIEKGFLKAVRAATADRRCHIASLIANGIANSTLPEDKLIFLLGVLDQVNDSEIIHLGYFAQPNPEAQAAYRQKHAEILEEDSVEDEPSQPDASERQTFRVAFVLHLSQVGLLERKMAATWDGPTTETGYEITNLRSSLTRTNPALRAAATASFCI